MPTLMIDDGQGTCLTIGWMSEEVARILARSLYLRHATVDSVHVQGGDDTNGQVEIAMMITIPDPAAP